MQAIQAILTRKSVRKYMDKPVEESLIEQVLLAGTRAPSGKGNEPWRFAVIQDIECKENIAQLCQYGDIIRGAPVLICQFLDTNVAYDTVKDAGSMGACAQNMLLAAHSLGLGAVWIAEIRRNKEEVAKLCGVSAQEYELMMVMPLGYSDESETPRKRKLSVQDCMIARK